MKKNYIIQDVETPCDIICFDSLKSLKNYINKYGYQFKQLLDSRTWSIISIGTIKDIPSEIGYLEREIYVKEIGTYRY